MRASIVGPSVARKYVHYIAQKKIPLLFCGLHTCIIYASCIYAPHCPQRRILCFPFFPSFPALLGPAGGAVTCFFLYTDSLLLAPQYSWLLPAQSILHSAAGAAKEDVARLLPQ